MIVDRARSTALEQPAPVEDGDLVTHKQSFGLVVRHVDQCRAEAAMQVDHLVA